MLTTENKKTNRSRKAANKSSEDAIQVDNDELSQSQKPSTKRPPSPEKDTKKRIRKAKEEEEVKVVATPVPSNSKKRKSTEVPLEEPTEHKPPTADHLTLPKSAKKSKKNGKEPLEISNVPAILETSPKKQKGGRRGRKSASMTSVADPKEKTIERTESDSGKKQIRTPNGNKKTSEEEVVGTLDSEKTLTKNAKESLSIQTDLMQEAAETLVTLVSPISEKPSKKIKSEIQTPVLRITLEKSTKKRIPSIRSPQQAIQTPGPAINQPKKSMKKVTLKLSKKEIPEQEEETDPDPEMPFFGTLLSPEEANTSKCTPSRTDVEHYNEAAQKARSLLETLHQPPDPPPDPEQSSVAQTKQIHIGKFEIDTWFVAPYPEEYNRLSKLYLCEFCLKYMKSPFALDRHRLKCPLTHPPGDEIYHDGNISVFEVDGRKNKVYCQNLCLLAKSFLDHKTLYYDVEPFLFYVMCEREEYGYRFIGYFSKEKRSISNNNVSCIVTLPVYQRKGYGNFLIDFSYLLSKKENICGSPERPLSDLGLVAYRYYWRNTIMKTLLEHGDSISIQADDVARTLHELDVIFKDENGNYSIRIDEKVYREELQRIEAKGYLQLKPECLKWTPSLFKRFIPEVVEPAKV